jgi:23S rRNA (guanosine2251-2'-O)-methyltransferase
MTTLPNNDIIYGRGPVRELLRSDRQAEYLLLQKGLEGSVGQLIALAKQKGIPVKEADVRKLDELCGGGNHQGVAAQVSAARYYELEDLLKLAKDEPPLLVIADEIEDPHNLGAIIRTAEAAGAHGLILPKRRSAGLSQTVAKTSAGAVEHLPVARVSNLPTTIKLLKERGVWIYGAHMEGVPYTQVDF